MSYTSVALYAVVMQGNKDFADDVVIEDSFKTFL